jgi:cytochrome b561
MRESRKHDGSRAPFDLFTVFLHWLTVVLVSAQLLTGYAMVLRPDLMPSILLVHRSMGVIVIAATTVRLLWRQSFARFPAFPQGMPRALQWLATRSEHALYVLLLFQPVSGFSASVLRGRSFEIFAFHVPVLLPRNMDLWLLMQTAHRAGAYALAGLAAGHALMALVHHYLLRDDVLVMMAPWARTTPRRAPEKNLLAKVRETAASG